VSNRERILRELTDIPRQIVFNRSQEQFHAGFSSAADIAVTILTNEIDSLLGAISGGRSLSDVEQRLLADLLKIRTDTLERFDAFWSEETPPVTS